MALVSRLGRYFLFLGSMARNREKWGVYVRQVFEEATSIGIGSVFIVAIVSTFIGAVTCVQTAYNLVSPLMVEGGLLIVTSTML